MNIREQSKFPSLYQKFVLTGLLIVVSLRSIRIDKMWPKLNTGQYIQFVLRIVFKIFFLANFDYSGQIGISHLPYKEISNITQNILSLGVIIVLLRDKSKVLYILVKKELL